MFADGPAPVTRRLRRACAADAGVTLVEVLVAFGVMSVVMALFTAGVAQSYRVANKADAMAVARQQLHTAFLRLDRDVRYALRYPVARRRRRQELRRVRRQQH